MATGAVKARNTLLHSAPKPTICAGIKANSDGMITMKTYLLSFGLAVGLCAQALAQLSPGNPLSGLEKLKDFESMRASSSDSDWHNGNADSRPIEPGGTLVLADLKGPGMITHFWNTIAHQAPFYSRLMTLRIYWDGEKNPSVECPIGDFFGIGHGLDKPFVSLPIKVSSDGRGRNCYWPMPFRKSARITVTNDSDKRCDAFYYYLDWQKCKSLPKDTAYFHAMYRQEYPCIMGRNYLHGRPRGPRAITSAPCRAWSTCPRAGMARGTISSSSTGRLSRACGARARRIISATAGDSASMTGRTTACRLWEGYAAGNRGSVYRFHIPDPVAFKKSLRVEIEHKGSQQFPDKTGSGFIERDDLMSSVAFWYQTEPHKPWPADACGHGAAGGADAATGHRLEGGARRPNTRTQRSMCRTCRAFPRRANSSSSPRWTTKGGWSARSR